MAGTSKTSGASGMKFFARTSGLILLALLIGFVEFSGITARLTLGGSGASSSASSASSSSSAYGTTTVACGETDRCQTTPTGNPLTFCGTYVNASGQERQNCAAYADAVHGHDGTYDPVVCTAAVHGKCWEKDGSDTIRACIHEGYTAVQGWHVCPLDLNDRANWGDVIEDHPGHCVYQKDLGGGNKMTTDVHYNDPAHPC